MTGLLRGVFPEGVPWHVRAVFVELDPPAVAVETVSGAVVRSYA